MNSGFNFLKMFSTSKNSDFITLITYEWRFLLYGLLMSLWSSFGQTFFISLFSAEIRQELNLSHGEFGTYYAIATTASALSLLWVGKLADTQSVHRLSLITLLSVCMSSLFFSFVDSVFMLILGLYLLRLSGQGMMFHVYSTAVTRRYSLVRGKALAICGFGMNLAEASLPVFIIIILNYFDWRTIWIALPVFAFFTLGPFVKKLTLKKNKECFKLESAEIKQSSYLPSLKRSDAVKDVAFWLVVIWLLVVPGFTITGIFFHQIYLSQLKSIPLWLWSTNYIWYAIASVSGAFISGVLVDRFTAHKIASLTQLPMVFSCLFLWFGNGTISLAFFFVFFGLSGGMLQPMINSLLAERYGTDWLGEIKSLLWALSVFSSALSPIIMGLMIDKGGGLNELMLLLVCLSSFSLLTPIIWFNILGFIAPSERSS